jgi:NTP pyrophosphatase (non-canonical NTP hydrolase)
MNLSDIKEEIIKFRDQRDWKQFHNPKDLATAIAIEAGELQEKFLWKSQEESYEIWKNDIEVHEEFADILNYLILFAVECNIDVEKIMMDKIAKNHAKYSVEKAKGSSEKYTKL